LPMTGFAAMFIAKGVVKTPELETETSIEQVDISAEGLAEAALAEGALVEAGAIFALPTLPDEVVQKGMSNLDMTGPTMADPKMTASINDPTFAPKPTVVVEGASPKIVTNDFGGINDVSDTQPDLSPDLPQNNSRLDPGQETPFTTPKAERDLRYDLPAGQVIAPQIGISDTALRDLGISVASQSVLPQIVQSLPILPQPMAISLAESMFQTQIQDQPGRAPEQMMQTPPAAPAVSQAAVVFQMPVGKSDVMPIVKTIKPVQDPEVGKPSTTDLADDAAVIDFDPPAAAPVPLADVVKTLTQDGGPEGQPLPIKIDVAPLQSPQSTAPLANLPITVPQLAAQILPLSHAAKTGPIEVLLNPAELGNLRFEIHQKGEHVRVMLTAERPETLDLLRRNGEQLALEFRNAGFSGATLSFGQWGRSSDGQPPASFIANTEDDFVPGVLPPSVKSPIAQDNSRNLNLRL
jgi:hypothetical protein